MEQTITRYDRTYSIPFWVDADLEKTDQLMLGANVSVELFDERVAYLPSGFVTDFHSIPTLLWSIWPPYNTKTNLAAMVHDWLYMNWEQHLVNYPELNPLRTEKAREYADIAFLALMHQFSPDTSIRNYLYFTAVRLFGKRNWRRFRTERAKSGSL